MSNPPQIIFRTAMDDVSMSGYYIKTTHEIILISNFIDVPKLVQALSYIKIHTTNISEEAKFMRYNDILINFSGIKTYPSTLVHEFGHAMSTLAHNGLHHSDFTYILGNVKYHLSFNLGCNELWRLFSRNYVQSFIDKMVF